MAGLFSQRSTRERWMVRRNDGAKCVAQSRGLECMGTGTFLWWSGKSTKWTSKCRQSWEYGAKIVRQVSSWKPDGITWVRVELGAAALTPNTAANKSDELSWDQAEVR